MEEEKLSYYDGITAKEEMITEKQFNDFVEKLKWKLWEGKIEDTGKIIDKLADEMFPRRKGNE